MARLRPPLYSNIQPASIQMGFFDPIELSSLQNGTFHIEDKISFEQRFVGRLSDVLESRGFQINLLPGFGANKYYWHYHTYEIECANSNLSSLYADCANATSLTIQIRHLDDNRQFPAYNCVVNTKNASCVSSCTQLFASKYELVLTHRFDSQIEPAWISLDHDFKHKQYTLVHDNTISPCDKKLCCLCERRNLLSFFL